MSYSGHILGLFHEQARPDRDNYVKIVSENIPRKYAGQFVKQSENSLNSFGVPYDLGSAMHYDQFVCIIGIIINRIWDLI